MLRKIDSQQILFKYNIGNTLDEDKHPVYSPLKATYGHVISKRGEMSKQDYGLEIDYDIALILNYNKETKLISKDSALYIEEMPTCIFPDGDYKIVRIGDVKINQFTLYLKKVDGISYPKLYFNLDNEAILSFQLNYDYEKMVGYLPKNNYVPFNSKTKIWDREPVDINDTNHLIKLTNSKVINKLHRELKFERI